MARPKIPDGILRTMATLWVREKLLAEKENRKPVKARVWRLLHGNEHQEPSGSSQKISKSATEKYITILERQLSPSRLSLVEWRPWTDPEETSEERAFLLMVNTIKKTEQGLSLYEHEVKWARMIRVALAGLFPYGQYRIVCEYGDRESVASYLGEETFTEDLDSFLTYRAWIPENRLAYFMAVSSGIIKGATTMFLMEPGWNDSLASVVGITRRPVRFKDLHLLTDIFVGALLPTGPYHIKGDKETIKLLFHQEVLKFWANQDLLGETLDEIMDVWANREETQTSLPKKRETDERFDT